MQIRTDLSTMVLHHSKPLNPNKWVAPLMLAVVVLATVMVLAMAKGMFATPNIEVSRMLEGSDVHIQFQASGLSKLERGGFWHSEFLRVTTVAGYTVATYEMPSTSRYYQLALADGHVTYTGPGPAAGESMDNFEGAMLADIKQAAADVQNLGNAALSSAGR